jgi:imidazolonepropionase-like amidohydrolase
MRAAGVRVALGTDSRASNPDLSVLEEVRHVADRFAGVSPAQALRMATLDAAEALGLADDVGSLTVGKRADLVAISFDSAKADPYAAALASAGVPNRVWLGGQRVYAPAFR